MKLRNFGQVALASVVSLGLVFGITACGSSAIDYVYVTSSKQNPGLVYAYTVDAQSGSLHGLANQSYPSGGRNPVTLLTSPNSLNLYVVNHDENNIVQFAIGTDGKLYPQHTWNTPGTFPTAAAINAAGTFLFVVDTYQPGYTAANPGPGALVVYPVASDGTLGTPVSNGNLSYFPLGNNPTGVAVLPSGNTVYAVVNGDKNVAAFTVASTGSLTSLGTVSAGVGPTAITTDSKSRWVYVTDSSSNQLLGYNVQANGTLVKMTKSPFATGGFPDAVTVHPAGNLLFVANYNSNNVATYTIDQASGNVTALGGAATFGTGAGPTCIVVDPNIQEFLYTSNFLDGTITGLQVNTTSGALQSVQDSAFSTGGQPTCTAAIAHNSQTSKR